MTTDDPIFAQMRRALGLAEPAEPDDPEKYEAIPAEFTWTNDEWALEHLPSVRAAVVICRADWREGDRIAKRMIADDAETLFNTVDGFKSVREHLTAMGQLLEAAEARLLLSARRVASA